MTQEIITIEKIKARADAIFAGTDMSLPGEKSDRMTDVRVRHHPTTRETEAVVTANGFELAKITKRMDEEGKPAETLRITLTGYRPGCGEVYVEARKNSPQEQFRVTFNEMLGTGGHFGGKLEDFDHPIHRGALDSIAELLKIK